MPGQRGVINSAFHLWFRAFPIQEDDHLLTVLRYIECNPLRAGLVYAAEHWPWSRLPRPPTFFASRHQAQTAAGALYRAHTTPPLLVVRLSTP